MRLLFLDMRRLIGLFCIFKKLSTSKMQLLLLVIQSLRMQIAFKRSLFIQNYLNLSQKLLSEEMFFTKKSF